MFPMRVVLGSRVFVSAVAYTVIAWLLFELVERTMPVGIPRLLITSILGFGFPVVIVLAWILSGSSVRRRANTATVAMLGFALLLWLNNSSSFTERDAGPYLIAHRGVHQSMNPEHDSVYECLGRIYPPEHEFIENTIPSIEEAFRYGARFVEIDIRPTADNDFAVFHDDTLDCKTEAKGPVRQRTMAELRELDVGYGYFTADGEHPLRGKGVGLMRSLDDVLDAFPGKSFIIDVKFGNSRELWSRLVEYLGKRSIEDQQRLAVVGIPHGVDFLSQALPDVMASSYSRALQCARSYILLGWSGFVQDVCRRSIVGTYANTGWVYWGWPDKFVDRMEGAGSIVLMRARGDPEQDFAASIPEGYSGGIETDRIEKFRLWMSQQVH